jgi:phosphate starvation-inducible PhoH-like protein
MKHRANSENVTADLEIADTEILLRVLGPNDSYAKLVKKAFRIKVWLRGNLIKMSGPEDSIQDAEKVFLALVSAVRKGVDIDDFEVEKTINAVANLPGTAAEKKQAVVQVKGAKTVAAKTQAQEDYLQAIRENNMTLGIGPAGSGKSYLAMSIGVSELLMKRYKKIILTRPAVEAGENLGFLPGDLNEKIAPYLRPLYDALEDLVDMDKAKDLITKGVIEIAPLAFMRGRTLSNAFVILDEAQNTTCEQMKMFLTRIGYGSKVVITGDITQNDLPSGMRSGLHDALQLLEGVEGINITKFSSVDVVRSPLVQRIVRAYDARDERRKKDNN